MDGHGPRLGTQVSPMTAGLRAFFGAPKDAGLLVQGIEPGGAAEGAKMQVGDVLVEVGGQRVERVADVRRALAGRHAGDVVEVEVVRKKQRKTLEATLITDGRSFSFTMPPGSDFERKLPPEAKRHRTRAQVQRQLEHARERLHEAERTLDALEQSHGEGSGKGKGKGKRKGKRKRKTAD